jgi:hypothetical protein
MFSGQIAINTNCGSSVCRSFAFTPKILPTESYPIGLAQGTRTEMRKEKKAILHNFSAT